MATDKQPRKSAGKTKSFVKDTKPAKPAAKKKKAANKSKADKKKKAAPAKKSAAKNSQSAAIEDKKSKVSVVGIGASAGGLEALRLMLPNLPGEGMFSYLIVQHLDPKHPSMLTSLLTRYTSMEVMELKQRQEPRPNVIYITPPDKEVTIQDGVITLSKTIAEIGPKPSIDHFFTSLADDQGDKSVGIILSGTGSDGAHGMRAIKAVGGLTIVQEQNTAKYDGMPNAAIETGQVDLILPPQKIGPELLSTIKFPPVVPIMSPRVSDTHLNNMQRIFKLLQDKTGVNFSNYKINTIQRRIGRRMAVHKLLELHNYVELLESSTKEVSLLYKDVLISVTSFFRDTEAFKGMERVIPDIMKKKLANEDLRIWIAGCATGEEAYSVAIMLLESLGDTAAKYNIQIFATDLDSDAIIRARKATYPESIVSGLSRDIIKRYFIQRDNTYQVAKSLRELVVFATQDITKDPPFSKLDLIVCRNLLIYFNAMLQKRILSMFHYSLNPGGYLFLGRSETVGQHDDLFEVVNKRQKIFRRRENLKRHLMEFGNMRIPKYKYVLFKDKVETADESLKDAMNRTIAETYGYPGVIIDDRLEIQYIRADVASFLKLAPGKAGLNILDMANDTLRLDLRAVIHKSIRENSVARSRSVKLRMGEEVRLVHITVIPLMLQHSGPSASVVLFESEAAPKEQPGAVEKEPRDDIDTRIKELEQELAATREHLNTTVEELETANEELQSLNEELQSSNEELQSSNEELETANEELQSTNEELTTVNEEYQVKSNELAVLNNDLENIFHRVGVAIIIVDEYLKVTSFSSMASSIFHLMAGDIGQVITSVPTKLDIPDLRKNIQSVIRTKEEWIGEFSLEGKILLIKILPYFDEGAQNATGAIITLNDITDRKKLDEDLLHSEQRYALAQRAANIGSWDWNMITDELFWSEQIEPMFGFGPGEFRRTYDGFLECVHEEDRQLVSDKVKECVENNTDYNIEHRIVWPDGSIHWVAESGEVFHDIDGKAVRMVGIVRDITHQKQNDSLMASKKALMDAIEGEVCIIDTEMNVISSNAAFRKRYGNASKCYEAMYGLKKPCTGDERNCPLSKALKTGKPAISAHHINPGTDDKSKVIISISPIIGADGNIERLIHISKSE